jgi:pleckstrin homology domain-containing family F
MDENERRVQAVENAFGSSGLPLVQPGRILIGEGTLIKMCRKKAKQRQFFLFNDILLYGSIVIQNTKFNAQHILELDHVKVESLPDSDCSKNGFIIKSPKKSFTVYTFTPDEKTQWMTYIRKYAQECLSRNGGRGAGVEISPVWIPDSAASRCLHCHKTEFSMFNRRHHCRKCGKVVCSQCSNRRWVLPNQSFHPLRVCLTCYTNLKGSEGAGELSQRKSQVMDKRTSIDPSDSMSHIKNNPEDSSSDDSDSDCDETTEQDRIQMEEQRRAFISASDATNPLPRS